MKILSTKSLTKLFSMLLAAVMLFSFAACGSAEDEQPDKEPYVSDAPSATASAEPDDNTFALNETAVYDGLKITATEMKESTGEEFFEPGDGNVFVGVCFTIENTSDQETSVSSLLQFAAYVDDVSCEYSLSAAMAFDGTVDGTLAPGKKLIGWYAVEVSENWKELQIDFTHDILSDSSASFVVSK